ncbi:MAG: cyclic nucleotide-binding domain-containing protein [Lentisphaerae bacterium]|jgi:CRP/FNR family transcriptional regulator, cyclic AMP receptor protein|nr:cyclic nucleotide-binding domain-containing protein [Lentisphaerota bacterium]MBT4822956.1 cyclic nucleotide-binding domain-containing protein [Lentisphaerota bacterium]MBT5611571.1 cyclic nucleotide-binding domain-containing protein [Lentisphaerota bacterium]MBT7057377.1 cyclic nucleotide-binding domain-containing protein [Lentisphaerota bacterium]MBT7841753.1 cyclic nucleotide-binding domain-containing protein [Lentisphaerota bacterium]
MSFRFQESRRFAPGEIVIREGDDSDEAYMIRAGTAEVLKRASSGKDVRIAVLDEGEIFGEMALILDRPRSATVRARSDLVVDVFDPEAFTCLFKAHEGLLLRPIFQVLCERLRVADARVAELEGRSGGPADEGEGLPLHMVVEICPASEAAKASLQGLESVPVAKFPFRVGRQDGDERHSPFHANDLCLLDAEPFSVSPSHFAVVRSQDTCFFQDRSSKHGSLVNGKRVGGGFRNAGRVPLRCGKNSVRLGGRESELLYSVLVKQEETGVGPFWQRLRGYLHLPFAG